MKIGIILTPYGEKNPAGLGGYILNLTLELIRQKKDWHFYIFIKGEHDVSVFSAFENVTIRFISNTFLWKDIAYIKNRHVDIWLYNNPNIPLVFKPMKIIVIALDFSFFYPEGAQNFYEKSKKVISKKLQRIALQSATKIVCISQSTKNDLHKLFPDIYKKKVEVSMAGFSPVCEKYEMDISLKIPENYFLVVGVIKPRKNQLTAIEAFTLAKKRGLKSKLLICGKGSGEYFVRVMTEIKHSDYKDDISYLGYCSNETLVTLYKYARALVFPSHIEGFGMPILEAMSCGTPVITSKNGALGEVAGDAALTVDSADVEGFATAMLRFENGSLRDQYIKKGTIRASEFSWEKTANEFAVLLSDAVKNVE